MSERGGGETELLQVYSNDDVAYVSEKIYNTVIIRDVRQAANVA